MRCTTNTAAAIRVYPGFYPLFEDALLAAIPFDRFDVAEEWIAEGEVTREEAAAYCRVRSAKALESADRLAQWGEAERHAKAAAGWDALADKLEDAGVTVNAEAAE